MQKGMEDKVVRADCGPVTPVRTPKTWLESHSLIEAFFAATSHALECNRDKGGGCNFQPDDVAKLNIPIYLILLWLFVDPRWIGLCTSQGQEGRAPSRAEQSAGAASSGSDGAARHEGQRAVPGARRNQGDHLPLRSARWFLEKPRATGPGSLGGPKSGPLTCDFAPLLSEPRVAQPLLCATPSTDGRRSEPFAEER